MSSANPLKEQRLATGLTQLDLAEQSGYSQQLISKLERGIVAITPAHATKLSAVLNCTAAELFPALALAPQPSGENEIEIELLVAFRSLPPDQRKVLLGTAQLMASAAQSANLNRVNAN